MADDPTKPAGDMRDMGAYWHKVGAIMGGIETMRIGGETFLPKFANETQGDYNDRLRQTKFTNIFRDIVEHLSQRPFSRPVSLSDEAVTEMEEFQHDVDGSGSHLHVFAGEMMFAGIANVLDWIFVDYTPGVPLGATLAEEARLGARPMWRRIPAADMYAVYSEVIGGKEEFTHVRYREDAVIRDGFDEVVEKRVRVIEREPLESGGYGPPVSTLWRKTEKGWVQDEPETMPLSRIPLVPFVTGRRIGHSWSFHPPMRDAVDLQVEHYQQESAIKYASNLTAHPMLSASGVTPPVNEQNEPLPVPVGPKAVLWAPPDESTGRSGEWKFVEPSASSLDFLQRNLEVTARELRELGRQPLTAQSGNLTTIMSGMIAAKGNAAVQAWAQNLSDALESAFDLTAEWMGISGWEPKVNINTDFDLAGGSEDDFAHILKMAENGNISREALIHEAKRRSILDPDYNGDDDLDAILREMSRQDGDLDAAQAAPRRQADATLE